MKREVVKLRDVSVCLYEELRAWKSWGSRDKHARWPGRLHRTIARGVTTVGCDPMASSFEDRNSPNTARSAFDWHVQVQLYETMFNSTSEPSSA
jgi:hypothetical protein